jgi:Ser/Thr protein kinase RdoA (MazF antagonist)
MERGPGEAIVRKILRDEGFPAARPVLAAQCAASMAKLHSIDPSTITGLDSPDPVKRWRQTLDDLTEPHPAFELGLRYLEANRPQLGAQVVVHGDFRMGNVLVGPEGLTAVLDWELAHPGDPMEDLGWFCVRAWRFGNDHLPAGGDGPYDQLVEAYEAAGGTVDRGALLWWELLGTLTWGVMCILQRSAHTSGAVRSVELAAIGRRVCENEWDVLTLLDRAGWPGGLDGALPEATPLADPTTSSLHDRPTAAELVEAVREYLERDVMTSTEGRVQFHARVATNVLKTIERELRLSAAQLPAHEADLASLGVADERALADAIRSGSLDDRLPEVAAVVRRTVLAKLAVANPGYEVPKQGR